MSVHCLYMKMSIRVGKLCALNRGLETRGRGGGGVRGRKKRRRRPGTSTTWASGTSTAYPYILFPVPFCGNLSPVIINMSFFRRVYTMWQINTPIKAFYQWHHYHSSYSWFSNRYGLIHLNFDELWRHLRRRYLSLRHLRRPLPSLPTKSPRCTCVALFPHYPQKSSESKSYNKSTQTGTNLLPHFVTSLLWQVVSFGLKSTIRVTGRWNIALPHFVHCVLFVNSCINSVAFC